MSLRGLAALAALCLAACATPEAPFRAHLESGAERVRQCAEWYRQLDARIDADL